MTFTLPESIQLPQQSVMAALGKGLGTGIEAGASAALKNMLLKKQQNQLMQSLFPQQMPSGEAPSQGRSGWVMNPHDITVPPVSDS